MKKLVEHRKGLHIAGRDVTAILESWTLTLTLSAASAFASVVAFLKSEGVLIGNLTAVLSGTLLTLRIIWMFFEMHERFSNREIEKRMAEREEAERYHQDQVRRNSVLVDKLYDLLLRNKAEQDECFPDSKPDPKKGK